MDGFIESLMSQLNITINPFLVLVLLMLGALIKHTKATEKIDNVFIPAILVITSVAYTILKLPVFDRGYIVDGIASAIVNAGLAVAFHSSGKSIFDYINTKKITAAIAGTVADIVADNETTESVNIETREYNDYSADANTGVDRVETEVTKDVELHKLE